MFKTHQIICLLLLVAAPFRPSAASWTGNPVSFVESVPKIVSEVTEHSLQNRKQVVCNSDIIDLRGGTGKVNAIIQENEKKAKVSYAVDFVLGLASVGFLYAWLKQKELHMFSEYFLENGFCNSIKFPTQFGCSVFDWTVAGVTAMILMEYHKDVSKTGLIMGNGVLYPLAHGTAHFLMGKGIIDPTREIKGALSIGILSAILAMGPAAIVTNMQQIGINNKLILLSIFAALDIGLTAIFVKWIKAGGLALLYINVSINLLLFISRILLFNPFTSNQKRKNVAIEARINTFGPKVYWSLVTIAFMVLVMWMEPTQCGTKENLGWFAKIGGHIWFDVSLFLMAWISLQNAVKDESGPARKAFFY